MRLNNKIRKEIIDNWCVMNWSQYLDDILENFKQDCIAFTKLQIAERTELAKQLSSSPFKPYVVVATYINLSYGVRDRLEKIYKPFRISVIECPTYVGHYVSVSTTNKPIEQALDSLYDRHQKYESQLNQMRQFISSVTTTDKLIKLVPGIEKYIPEIEQGKSLISVDLVNNIKGIV